MIREKIVEESWKEIPGFPYYRISNLGRIYSELSKIYLKPNPTNFGHMKVNLRSLEKIPYEVETEPGIFELKSRLRVYTCSVAVLVAQAFVEPPNKHCDSVILLDGILTNVAAHNLAWRTKRHAWLYSHQLKEVQPLHYRNLPVVNQVTGEEYSCVVEAGMKEGLIFEDVWRSTYSGSRIAPYGDTFRIKEEV